VAWIGAEQKEELDFFGALPPNPQKRMVGTRRLELQTSTVSNLEPTRDDMIPKKT
jgi:hypothetical protein